MPDSIMNPTNFYGTFDSGDIAVVRELLRAWLRTDGLSEKLMMTGWQLVYETEDVYVYAYADHAGRSFLLEGHRRAGLEETRSWLQQLLDACTVRGVSAELEYMAVDPAGDEISEQYTLSAGK